MTIATLIRKTFDLCGLLTVSEVKSIIIMVGSWQHVGRRGTGEVAESPTSCRQQEVD